MHPGQGPLGNGNGQAPTPGIICNGDEPTSAAEEEHSVAGGSATALPSSMGLVLSSDRKFRVSSTREASSHNLMLQPKARAKANGRKLQQHMSEISQVSEVSQDITDQDDEQEDYQEVASRYHRRADQSGLYDAASSASEKDKDSDPSNKVTCKI